VLKRAPSSAPSRACPFRDSPERVAAQQQFPVSQPRCMVVRLVSAAPMLGSPDRVVEGG
jgi:hypothetical protein